jgi:hypothetical protein
VMAAFRERFNGHVTKAYVSDSNQFMVAYWSVYGDFSATLYSTRNNYCYYTVISVQSLESNALHATIQGTKLILGEKASNPLQLRAARIL